MTKEVQAQSSRQQGPRPLALHLGIQTMSWISSLSALPSLKDGSLNWSPRLASAANELRKKLEGIDPDLFRTAVEEQSRLRLSEFAGGVRAYRDFKRVARPQEPKVIWSEGTTRLLDYGTTTGGPIVLFIPSLINRAYILDIAERRSLLRDFARRGFRPLLVDWGAPSDLEANFSLDSYIAGRLVKALYAANTLADGPVAVAGYCMGGTLALGLAAIRPEQISALVLMATPWNFHAMDPGKTRMLEAMIPNIEKMLEVTSTLPVDVLQAMFTSIDAHLTSKKFRAFSALDKRSARAINFVALEDWLNDGVPLAGPAAMECLAGWYVENSPAQGKWKISAKTVMPEQVSVPSLVIVPTLDHIVPPASAMPLVEKMPDSSCLKIKAGHIGMVAGSRAKGTLYSPMAQWLDNIIS